MKCIDVLENFTDTYPKNIYVSRNIIQENIDENIKGLINNFFRSGDNFSLLGIYNDYKTKYLLNFRFDISLFQTAVAHRKLGFFEEAIDLLNFIENKSSGTIKELAQFEKAQIHFEKDDFVEARRIIIQFLKNQTKNFPLT